jgi:hypothetical protein
LANKNAENRFTLPGLGKLVLVNRKARMGRNPATGETIKIAAKRVVKFHIAKAAKDAILGKKYQLKFRDWAEDSCPPPFIAFLQTPKGLKIPLSLVLGLTQLTR